MKKALIDFVQSTSGGFDYGYVRFNNEYYFFSRNSNVYDISNIDYRNFVENFKVIFTSKLKIWIKTLEGVIHNSNGKLTPVYSRMGLVEPKVEEMGDEDDLRVILRIVKRVFAATKELVDMYNAIGDFIGLYSLDKVDEVNLKSFFEGFVQAVVTDREIKHKVDFKLEIQDEINKVLNCSEFFKVIYSLGESVFNLVRGKEGKIFFNVEINPGEEMEFIFEIEKMPSEIYKLESLGWSELQSAMYYDNFLKIVKKNNWKVEETGNGVLKVVI